jgi:hypothetical protein
VKNKIRLTYLFFALFTGILSAHPVEHQTSLDSDCVVCQLWSSETEIVHTPFEVELTCAVEEMILLHDLQGLYNSSFYSSLHVVNPNDRGPPSQI